MGLRWEVRGADRFSEQMRQRADALILATAKSADRGASVVQIEAQHQLTRYTHERGTPTPAPPGGPPALISGGLRRSIKTRPVRQIGFGRYEGRVGPTIVYGPIQERGGIIYPHGQYLSWTDSTGRRYFARMVTLPARPYMWYAVNYSRDEVLEQFAYAWNRALHDPL